MDQQSVNPTQELINHLINFHGVHPSLIRNDTEAQHNRRHEMDRPTHDITDRSSFREGNQVMTQTTSGIAGTLGIAQPDEAKPRLTLEPARCAVGISRSGAGFRVIHTLSGKELGMVYRTSEPGWGYWGFVLAGTTELHKPVWANATAAAVALAAHDLDRRLELVAARLGAVEWDLDAGEAER